MYRLLTLMGLAAIAILAVPQNSAAQECDFCWYSNNQHRFTGQVCTGIGGCKNCLYNPPRGDVPHNGCHAAWVGGYCWTHALLCDWGGMANLPEDEEVLTVVANRDVDGATELIRSGGVHLSLERRALQVLGCTGAVLSHIPIGDDFYTDLSVALQQVEDASVDPSG